MATLVASMRWGKRVGETGQSLPGHVLNCLVRGTDAVGCSEADGNHGGLEGRRWNRGWSAAM
jgi:hypothetical protein